jgi:hypothetical protein
MNDRLFFVFFSLVVTHEHVYSFAQQLFRWVLEIIWFSSISKAKLARPDKFSRQSKIVSRSLTPVWYRQRSQSPKTAPLSARKSEENSEVTNPLPVCDCNCNSSLSAKLPVLLSPSASRGLQTTEATDRRPCLLQCFLPAPPPSVPLAAAARVHSTPPTQVPSLTPPPKPPFQSTEANYVSASVEFAQSSCLEWRSIRAWVDLDFWW